MGVRGFLKFMFFRAVEGFVILFLILFLPNLPPYTNFSKSYKVVFPKLEGEFALNERLNGAEIWHKGDLLGPEAFAEYKGELYTSIHGGDIVKLTGNHVTPVIKFGKPCKGLYEEKICGRPLGLTFDARGYLYAADAYYGIYKVNVVTGDQENLVSMDVEIEGKKPKLPNSLAVANNGDIYWTDSSTDFLLQDGLFEMLSDGTSRLIHYNAKTGRNIVLMKDLLFANGVALSDYQDILLVAESGRNRIHKYHLRGPRKGKHEIFVDGLPGMPDNIKSIGPNGFLVSLVSPADADHPNLLQIFGPFPLLRKLGSRIMALTELGFDLLNQAYPNEICQRAMHFIGHFHSSAALIPYKRVTIVHLSNNGDILDVVHATDGRISSISEAHIFRDHLYLGSPFNDYIARIPLSKVGWSHLAKSTTGSPQKEGSAKTTAGSTATTTPEPSTTSTRKTTTTTPKPTTTTPRPTTTTPRPTTTTPKPTTTTPKPTTTTSKPTTTTKPTTTAAPKPSTTTPKPTTTTKTTTTTRPITTTTPKPTTTTAATPKQTSTTPKPVTTTTKPATTTPKPSTTTSKPSVTTSTAEPATKPSQKPAATTTKSSHEAGDSKKQSKQTGSTQKKNSDDHVTNVPADKSRPKN